MQHISHHVFFFRSFKHKQKKKQNHTEVKNTQKTLKFWTKSQRVDSTVVTKEGGAGRTEGGSRGVGGGVSLTSGLVASLNDRPLQQKILQQKSLLLLLLLLLLFISPRVRHSAYT